MLAMGLILVGTVIYVAVDKDLSSPSAAKVSIVRLQFMSGERGDLSGSFSLLCVTGVLQAYLWVCVWFSLLIFQLTYAKTLVSGLGLNSIW